MLHPFTLFIDVLKHLVQVFSPLKKLLDAFDVLILKVAANLFYFFVVLSLYIHLYSEELLLSIGFFDLHSLFKNLNQ